MQMYVCVLCVSCSSSQCCIMHDLQFVNAGRGSKRRPYGRSMLVERQFLIDVMRMCDFYILCRLCVPCCSFR